MSGRRYDLLQGTTGGAGLACTLVGGGLHLELGLEMLAPRVGLLAAVGCR